MFHPHTAPTTFRILGLSRLIFLAGIAACGGGGDGDLAQPAPAAASAPAPALPPSWDAAKALAPSDGSLQLATNDSGAAVAVWTAGGGGPDGTLTTVRASRYTPGSGWSAAQEIYANYRSRFSYGSTQMPQVALDAPGNAVVVWRNDTATARDDRYGLWSLRGTVDAGGRPVWSEGARIVGPGMPHASHAPVLAQVPGGAAVLAWVDVLPATASTPAQDNLVVTEGDGTRWSDPVALESLSGAVASPRLATGAGGHAAIAWQQGDDGGVARVQASLRTAAGRWSAPSVLSPGSGTMDQAADTPCIALGATGQAAVIWRQSPAGGGTPQLWASEITPAGAWTNGHRIDTDKSGAPMEPALAMDGAGNATAAWHQGDGSGYERVWSQHYRTDTGRWADQDVRVNTAEASQALSPQVAMDGQGRTMAVWTDTVNGNAQVFARRHDPASGWQASPVRIDGSGTNDGFSTAPRVGVGPTGRTLAAWLQVQGSTLMAWANHAE